MKTPHIMKGYGPLDLFLAKQRYKIAGRKIKSAPQNGRILDIGCGSYSLFLTEVDFKEKYGLDKNIEDDVKNRMAEQQIKLINHYIESEEELPFENDYFDAITMLAVFEHIEPEHLVRIHRQIHRILKPGGVYFMTTPAVWTENLLRFLGKLRLISETISEHKDSYNHSMISSILRQADFEKSKMQFGYFELWMNNWFAAVK